MASPLPTPPGMSFQSVLTDPWTGSQSSQAPCLGGSSQASHKTSETGHTLWGPDTPSPQLGEERLFPASLSHTAATSLAVQVTQCHSGEGTNEKWDVELVVQAKISGAVAGAGRNT